MMVFAITELTWGKKSQIHAGRGRETVTGMGSIMAAVVGMDLEIKR